MLSKYNKKKEKKNNSHSSMFYFFFKVHIPSSSQQIGPIYSLTPRKCGIFGVCCEAIPLQHNYLIDEAVDTGQGGNTVVSMLHHYLENHTIRARNIHLHADNCVGQNKNNTMIQVYIIKYKAFCALACLYLL